MKFNLGTFIFQIINFIVLLFILKRLLYRPVREMLQKRRDLVEETVRSAENTRKEALALRETHRREMEKLDEDRERMLQCMKEETFEERKKLLAEAREEAALLIEKEKALFVAEKVRLEGELKENAVEVATLFSSRMLADIADDELHRGIWRRFLAQLARIAGELGRRGPGGEPVSLELVSAYDLPEESLEEMRTVMESYLSTSVTLHSSVKKELIAGVVLRARDFVYDFSLSGQVADLKRRLHGVV